MKRASFKSLAEQSGYSLSTFFRVLRNEPGVRPETREVVIRLLNIHGYMVENRVGTEKVVVDLSVDNLYAERLAEMILARLRQENYRTVKTDSFSQPARLRRELADADVAVFCGLPAAGTEWLRTARDINPEIYRVCIFGEDPEHSDLFIAADNQGGSLAAADFLCKNFRSIAVFHNPDHEDSAERSAIFYGRALARYPQIRCDLATYRDEWQIREFYRKHGEEYEAFFYQNGTPWVTLAPLLKQDRREVFQLLFNNPDDIVSIRNIEPPSKLDAYIDFSIDQIGDFTAFYLRNRPLLNCQPRLITLLPTQLKLNNRKFKNEERI